MQQTAQRLLIALFLTAVCISTAAAQSFTTIKFGTLNPKDAKAGLIVGISTGRQVDERVDFGLGVDLFLRRFTEETAVESDGSGETDPSTFQTNIAYSVYALPILIQVNVHLLPGNVIKPYIGLAGGYEIVFSREANYLTSSKDNRLYGGFGWQLMLGGEYSLGSASGILGEIFYNGCTVKRNKGSTEFGFPLHEKLNFSGIGFRIGLRFGGI